MSRLIALCVLAGGSTVASADLIDFEGLEHGRIVADQYAALGVTISAVNPNRSFDLAVAFDTNLSGTRDSDLESPWSGGNLPVNSDIGNVLIIQENDNGIADGIADNPDDEGRRAAGQLIFSFNQNIQTIGFDLVDLEGSTSEASTIELFRDNTSVLSIGFAAFEAGGTFDQGAIYLDNSLNRISGITVAGGFDRAVFRLGGSAGIDNINYTVPTPGALALLGLGGLLAGRRRR